MKQHAALLLVQAGISLERHAGSGRIVEEVVMAKTMHLDELETIADAYLMASAQLDLEISVFDSPEVNLLRAIVIAASEHQREVAVLLDSNHTMPIAHRATRLFRRFGGRSAI